MRALGAAHIRSAVVAAAGAPARLSRHADAAWSVDPGPGRLVDVLAGQGAPDEPRVLFYDSDAALLEISRTRDRLAEGFRIPLPHAELIEDLVDKRRFQALGERLGLDVPVARHVSPAGSSPGDLGMPFPLVLKAVPFRDARWDALGENAKALFVEDRPALERLWPRLAAARLDLLAQEAVLGGEEDIFSHHVYVDDAGTVAGEFTGRKIRTFPNRLGQSSALVTTDDPQVAAAGGEIVGRLGLRGPAKLDFKRDPTGRLRLLEVNPRFTLWVEPGAVAGVNLAALAYADLTGGTRPPARRARAGVRWVNPRLDLAAARELGLGLPGWAWFVLRCETNEAVARDDPRALWRHLRHRRRAGA